MENFVGRKNLISRERLRELTRRSDMKGGLQMASHLGAIVLTGIGIHLTWGSAGGGWGGAWSGVWGGWLALPFFILHGTLLNYLFAAQHECNHYTAFRTRWVNDVFNRITGFIQLYPRDYERWYHFEHHRHTGNWRRDAELISRHEPYTLRSYLPYLVGVTYWTGRIQRLFIVAGGVTWPYFNEKQSRKAIRESRAHLALYAGVIAGSLYLGSWAALTYWIAPMFATKIFQNVQNITEHTGLTHIPDTVHNTRTIKTWWIFRWMAWNMQYHTAHHTFPAAPFHKLPALHAELVKQAGYEPPTTGYLAFQWRFIRRLMKGPESWEGEAEIPPATAEVTGTAGATGRAAGGKQPSTA